MSSVLLTAGAVAQTHVVKPAVPVVRAVAVYEWTGELGKATASRVVPVSMYIDQSYQDAGVYLARPIPLALENGNVFELERAGVPDGTLELAFARHVEVPNDAPQATHMDDGWFAYGQVKPKPAELAAAVPRKSGPLPVIVAGRRTTSDPAAAGQGAAGTTDRSGAAGAGTTVSAGAAPPVRPIDIDATPLKKGDPDSDSAKDDPDRPTLKRRSPAERKEAQKRADKASVVGAGDLNDDPDRPTLHRGKPASRLEEDDLPPLRGVPAAMQQMIAVSDARNRPEHDFARAWESTQERAEVLGEMRALAQQKVAGYGGAVAPAVMPAAKKPVRAAGQRRPAASAVAPVPIRFDGKSEELKGYTLSYGGAATYVYSGATSDAVPVLVTIVAQREPDGTLKLALGSVTDAAHLDRTPQLRLVDAVDADASNRASLLFERRGATEREFVLYRVLGAQAEEELVAGVR